MGSELLRSPDRGGVHLNEGALSARLSWGSIFGGTVAALAVWLLLYSLGLALGLTSMEANDPGSARGAGIFTGIWGLVTPLIALFIGGFVASRSADLASRSGGVFHGLVVWGLTLLVGAYFVMNVISGVLGTAIGATKSVAGAVAGTASGAVQGSGGALQNVAQNFGLDANDALAPINERLRAEGKPAITANQLQGAVQDVMNTAVREGSIDRQMLVSSVAQNTALSRQDAEEVANRIEAQFSQARAQAGATMNNVTQQVQTGALQAAEATGKAFWGVFLALLFGLGSAIGGAVVGIKKRRDVVEDRARTAAPVATTGIGHNREVYP